MKITDEQIRATCCATTYTSRHPHHEHPDCVRIAVEWLAAQTRTKHPTRRSFALKHLIESWAGRYVSRDDVEVAALLLGLEGRYPLFNISSRLTRPNLMRLQGIGEAMTHKNHLGRFDYVYFAVEEQFSSPSLPLERGGFTPRKEMV